MSSDYNSAHPGGDGEGGEEASQMDDFSSVDFSMTEFNIKDSLDTKEPSKHTEASSDCPMLNNSSTQNDSFSIKDVREDIDIAGGDGMIGSRRESNTDVVETVSPGLKTDGGSSVVKKQLAQAKNKKECYGDGTTCAECGKTFSHTFYFGTHITSHMGEKNYTPVGQCGMCGLVFADVVVYQAHMMALQSRLDEMSNADVEKQESKKVKKSTSQAKFQSGQRNDNIRQQNQPLHQKMKQISKGPLLQESPKPPAQLTVSNNARTEPATKRPAEPSSPTSGTEEGGTLPKKRIRKAPIKFEALPEVKRVRTVKRKLSTSLSLPAESSFAPDCDPEVERYLQSLKDMGLTVDPDAFGVKGSGGVKRGKGFSGGRGSGKIEIKSGVGDRGRGSNFGRGVSDSHRGTEGRGGMVQSFQMRGRRGGGGVGHFGAVGRGGVGVAAGVPFKDKMKKDVSRVDLWHNHANRVVPTPTPSYRAKPNAHFGGGVPRKDIPPVVRRHTWNDNVSVKKDTSNNMPYSHLGPFPPREQHSGFLPPREQQHSGSFPPREQQHSGSFPPRDQHSGLVYNQGGNRHPQMFPGRAMHLPKRLTREEEDEEIVSLMSADLEIMPKSGKQTRGERLRQRHERLSHPDEPSEELGKRKTVHYNPPKEEKPKKGKGKKLLKIGSGLGSNGGVREEALDKSAYGVSWNVANNSNDSDDDVQIVNVEESSNSPSSHPSKSFPVISSVSGAQRPSIASTNQNKNNPPKVIGKVGKVTNVEGNMERLRKEAREKVEAMIAFPESVFRNIHSTDKTNGDDIVPILSSLKYCGEDAEVKGEDGDWCVEERKSDEEDDDNGGESGKKDKVKGAGSELKEVNLSKTGETAVGDVKNKEGEISERKSTNAEGGEKEKEDREEDIQEGDDIAGWTVSISAMSDSEEEAGAEIKEKRKDCKRGEGEDGEKNEATEEGEDDGGEKDDNEREDEDGEKNEALEEDDGEKNEFEEDDREQAMEEDDGEKNEATEEDDGEKNEATEEDDGEKNEATEEEDREKEQATEEGEEDDREQATEESNEKHGDGSMDGVTGTPNAKDDVEMKDDDKGEGVEGGEEDDEIEEEDDEGVEDVVMEGERERTKNEETEDGGVNEEEENGEKNDDEEKEVCKEIEEGDREKDSVDDIEKEGREVFENFREEEIEKNDDIEEVENEGEDMEREKDDTERVVEGEMKGIDATMDEDTDVREGNEDTDVREGNEDTDVREGNEDTDVREGNEESGDVDTAINDDDDREGEES